MKKKKKTVKHDGDTNRNLGDQYTHHKTYTETRRLEKKRTSRDHPNYQVIKIGQITDKNPGDLRRLAVTQIPEKITS